MLWNYQLPVNKPFQNTTCQYIHDLQQTQAFARILIWIYNQYLYFLEYFRLNIIHFHWNILLTFFFHFYSFHTFVLSKWALCVWGNERKSHEGLCKFRSSEKQISTWKKKKENTQKRFIRADTSKSELKGQGVGWCWDSYPHCR